MQNASAQTVIGQKGDEVGLEHPPTGRPGLAGATLLNFQKLRVLRNPSLTSNDLGLIIPNLRLQKEKYI